MSKQSLLEAFDLKQKPLSFQNLSDYELFPDKKLLDSLRDKIVESVIDKEIKEENKSSLEMNHIIDRVVEGIDLTNIERSYLYHLIDNELNGFGPLTELLQDDNISEIMVNSPNEIYIEIDGHLQKDESVSFINQDHILRTVERLIGPSARALNAQNPMIEYRLMDGTRIYVIIPPLAVKGPVVTIKKIRRELTSMEDLVRVGTVTPYMATFLEAAVKGGCNILVCGGNGSGKTTLLNILGSFIPDDERIITIEEATELQIMKKHVVSLKMQSTEYAGNITMGNLIQNALRMRPDRLIVGEIKGQEAFELLRAMHTGHDGSLASLYATGAKDALRRLETMIGMNQMDFSTKTIRQYISSSIDLIVYIERMSDGKRKVKAISEIKEKKDELFLENIFAFEQHGLTDTKEVDGMYILYDKKVPDVYHKIKNHGIDTIDFMFHQGQE